MPVVKRRGQSGIRVLVIAPPRASAGGQAVQADRLLDALEAQEGIDVDYLPSPPTLPLVLRPLQRLRFLRTAVNAIAMQAKLLARIRRVAVVHVFTAAHSAFLWVPLPALVAARLWGRKSVLNYRDGRAEDHLRDWRSARVLLGLADELVANSPYLVDVFARHGLRARAIFNIIDPSAFRYRPRTRLKPAFLHNRGMEPLYNIPCTLRAFQLVQRRYPEATLTLAHDGPDRAALEDMAGALRLRNVRFVGRVSQESMKDLYDRADIYWMSPNVDCMPGSILECYASGIPAIATRVGGIPYILFHEHTGLLVEPNDHEAMARSAFRLLEEEGLAARLTSNARLELRKYEAARIGAKWATLYRELTGLAPSSAKKKEITSAR